MSAQFQGKAILITGATAGIGLAAAQSLIEQGASLVITGRDQGRLQQATQRLEALAVQPHKQSVIGVLCDSANVEQIQQMAAQLQRDQIKLDGVLLNAGVFYPEAFEQTSLENITTTMAVNFTGPAVTLQALLPCLNQPASVVFVSSVAVLKAFATAGVYSASKAAFEGLARVLNVELAERGVRINTIRPGVTATEIQAKAGMDEASIAAFFASLSSIPVGRVLEPRDLVPAIDYLLSDSSIGLRNAHIDIDGGFGL
ncbi:SDR family NAD(P)-dependent oxidoreductase [Motilimonas eburnea]|uniref:SDR family NAD(P)-dependent oxidoreductase n=1 Tax=Motilimonas eburnea TaxID=1737488 RepID=UPI001E3B0566|nr:SDR family oxidoreductase [Motilimonas eburnea]MCE2571179.1 SDR family oxidoreductase [Motilimonas eburnea]